MIVLPDGGLDIGHGVRLDYVTADGQGNQIGLHESHPSSSLTATDGRCFGFVRFDTPESRTAAPGPDLPFWTVESWEPLTLSPSILCRICGNHGYIRNGVWVPS